MTKEELRKKFKEETGMNWLNSQEEPDIDYVDWLERHLTHTFRVSKYAMSQEKIPNDIAEIVDENLTKLL